MFDIPDGEIDIKAIALRIANEQAVKSDGTPLSYDGKNINRLEKILRDWANSDSPDLTKRFVDIATKEERMEDKTLRDLLSFIVLACKGSDEVRASILERFENIAVKSGMDDVLKEATDLALRSLNKKNPKVAVYLPDNGRSTQVHE